MRKSTKQTDNNVEVPVFNASKVIKAYFNDVVILDNFIMAVDETGVFFFTTLDDQNTILVKLSNYTDQLALARDDIVVCRLGWDVQKIDNDVFFKRIQDKRFNDLLFTEINPECFEPAIRLLLSSRDVVLSREDIIEITECFQESVIVQNSLFDYLRDLGYDLDRHDIEKLEKKPIITLQDIINVYGENDASLELFDDITKFRESQYHRDPQEEANLQQYIHSNWDRASNLTVVLGFILFGASCAAFLLHLPVLGLIFSFFGILQGRHLALIYKTFMATILTWLNLATFLFGIIQTIVLLKPEILDALRQMLLIQR